MLNKSGRFNFAISISVLFCSIIGVFFLLVTSYGSYGFSDYENPSWMEAQSILEGKIALSTRTPGQSHRGF